MELTVYISKRKTRFFKQDMSADVYTPCRWMETPISLIFFVITKKHTQQGLGIHLVLHIRPKVWVALAAKNPQRSVRWCFPIQYFKRTLVIWKNRRWQQVSQECCCEECFNPQLKRNLAVIEHCETKLSYMSVFSLLETILLRSVGA